MASTGGESAGPAAFAIVSAYTDAAASAGWEDIDDLTVLECTVSPCSHKNSVPYGLRVQWASAIADVVQLIETAKLENNALMLERGLKWHMLLFDVLLRAPRRSTRGGGRGAGVVAHRFVAWRNGDRKRLLEQLKLDRQRAAARVTGGADGVCANTGTAALGTVVDIGRANTDHALLSSCTHQDDSVSPLASRGDGWRMGDAPSTSSGLDGEDDDPSCKLSCTSRAARRRVLRRARCASQRVVDERDPELQHAQTTAQARAASRVVAAAPAQPLRSASPAIPEPPAAFVAIRRSLSAEPTAAASAADSAPVPPACLAAASLVATAEEQRWARGGEAAASLEAALALVRERRARESETAASEVAETVSWRSSSSSSGASSCSSPPSPTGRQSSSRAGRQGSDRSQDPLSRRSRSPAWRRSSSEAGEVGVRLAVLEALLCSVESWGSGEAVEVLLGASRWVSSVAPSARIADAVETMVEAAAARGGAVCEGAGEEEESAEEKQAAAGRTAGELGSAAEEAPLPVSGTRTSSQRRCRRRVARARCTQDALSSALSFDASALGPAALPAVASRPAAAGDVSGQHAAAPAGRAQASPQQLPQLEAWELPACVGATAAAAMAPAHPTAGGGGAAAVSVGLARPLSASTSAERARLLPALFRDGEARLQEDETVSRILFRGVALPEEGEDGNASQFRQTALLHEEDEDDTGSAILDLIASLQPLEARADGPEDAAASPAGWRSSVTSSLWGGLNGSFGEVAPCDVSSVDGFNGARPPLDMSWGALAPMGSAAAVWMWDPYSVAGAICGATAPPSSLGGGPPAAAHQSWPFAAQAQTGGGSVW